MRFSVAADERKRYTCLTRFRPLDSKSLTCFYRSRTMNIKLSLAFLALSCAAAASADTLYSTSFEAPTYTAGSSINGIDGWTVGRFNDTSTQQSISTSLSNGGSQGLRLNSPYVTDAQGNPEGISGSYSIGRALPASTTTGEFTVSVDLFLDGSSFENRSYGLSLMNNTDGTNGGINFLGGVNIDSLGRVRASTNSSTLGSPNGGFGYFAPAKRLAAGTYLNRWLTFSMTVYNDYYNTVDVTISGLGGATSSVNTQLYYGGGWNAGSYTSYKGVNLLTAPIGAAGFEGLGTFDNFKITAPTPVPEPATMAALGLGVAAMLRRRRKA